MRSSPGSLTDAEALNFNTLNTANHLLGDQKGLHDALKREGYWYFRNVLDLEAVAALRAEDAAELVRQDVIDPDDPSAVYTGKPFDETAFRMNLRKGSAWRSFVQNPRIDQFFRELLGDNPFWIPNVRTRATPPASGADKERLVFIHQDGAFNPGIPFFVTWVPLAVITQSMGGVALAEGQNERGILHPVRDSQYEPIERAALPANRWKRADYQPGDLLMMDVMTPHSGLSNVSESFRLSIDLRVMRESGNRPLIGTITAINEHGLTVRDSETETSLQIDETTYCAGFDGKKTARDRIPLAFPVGTSVVVGRNRMLATVVRPPTN